MKRPLETHIFIIYIQCTMYVHTTTKNNELTEMLTHTKGGVVMECQCIIVVITSSMYMYMYIHSMVISVASAPYWSQTVKLLHNSVSDSGLIPRLPSGYA